MGEFSSEFNVIFVESDIGVAGNELAPLDETIVQTHIKLTTL